MKAISGSLKMKLTHFVTFYSQKMTHPFIMHHAEHQWFQAWCILTFYNCQGGSWVEKRKLAQSKVWNRTKPNQVYFGLNAFYSLCPFPFHNSQVQSSSEIWKNIHIDEISVSSSSLLQLWPTSPQWRHASPSQTPRERFLVCCVCEHSSPWKMTQGIMNVKWSFLVRIFKEGWRDGEGREQQTVRRVTEYETVDLTTTSQTTLMHSENNA